MLILRDLTKVFPGPVKAIADVDLEVRRGMFGLLGPNGAGKTTLMRMIAGLLEPTTGTIRLGGKDLVADPRRIWERLGYLPQDFGFYPQLTGRQMLAHLLRLKGVGEDRQQRARMVDELLASVNLSHAADRKVSSYSGGMRQRLGIAQAVAGDPAVIVVDEPTAGLDPEERQRFYRILAELADDRIVLLSTHIVEDVAVLCTRFAILCGGRVIADTTPAEAREGVEGRIFEAAVGRGESLPAGCRVTRSVLVEGRQRLRIFVPGGAPPPGFAAVPATLEDAYLMAIDGAQASAERVAA